MNLRHAVVITTLLLANITAAQAQTEPTSMDRTAILTTINTMTDAFAAGDMEGILSTYEQGATVVGQPGQPVSGDGPLREMFGQFISRGVAFTYGAHDVVVSGDIAVHLMKWTAPTPDGDVSALSVAVLRKQQDGTWKMVIDNPFGDSVMHALAEK
jgi:uncharacterized protein (TIGR02246 family)